MAIARVNYEAGGPGGEDQLSALRFAVVNFKLDSSYPTGGSTAVANALGFARIIAFIPLSNLGYHLEYLPESDRLKVYQQPSVATAGASPEVPNTTNLSANSVRALILGV